VCENDQVRGFFFFFRQKRIGRKRNKLVGLGEDLFVTR